MRSAFQKDIWRSITKSKKRFFAIMVITALGVAMLSGIKASCIDMRYTADAFFDAQNMFDIRVQSTMGLTEEDVKVLQEQKGVETAEPGISETVYTSLDGVREDAVISTLNRVNRPYVMEGRLPEKSGEIAVSFKYAANGGSKIGDVLSLEVIERGEGEQDSEKNEENQEENTAISLVQHDFEITGIVLDPMDISGDGSATAFRSSASEDFRFFILSEDIKSDVYTAVYLKLADAAEKLCYSKDYEEFVTRMTDQIEREIKTQREQSRHDAVYEEAAEKVKDAEQEMDKEFEDAETKIREAEQKLADGKIELSEGRSKLEEGRQNLKEKEQEAQQNISDARKQLEDGENQLQAGEIQFSQASAQLKEGETQLAQGKAEYEKNKKAADKQFADAHKQIDDAKGQTAAAKDALVAQQDSVVALFGEFWPAAEWEALVTAAEQEFLKVSQGTVSEDTVWSNVAGSWDAFLAKMMPLLTEQPNSGELLNALPQIALGLGKINAVEQQLTRQSEELAKQEKEAYQKLEEGANKIKENEAKLQAAGAQLSAARAELDANSIKLTEGKAELKKQEADAKTAFADARKKLDESGQELADGEQELLDGEKELSEKEREFADKKKEAVQELSDAKEKLSEIDMTKWYIQDRTSIDSYAALKSDTDSIEAVGTAFPILFFIVAVLISLTTITRMVEEDRGLIGTYKALGMRDGAIYGKYLCYAFAACLLGGILGDLLGFIAFPKFVWMIFSEMYTIPEFLLKFDFLYGLGGILLFMIGIVGATAFACKNELERLPAVLMRPRAPKAGTRVVLEKLPFVWKHLRFLSKVTVRNLFRYKKRLFMTVIGIMGCTALILCGFAIKDSVTELMPKQYGHIYQYDLMAVFEADNEDEMREKFSKDKNVDDYFMLQMDNLKIQNSEGRAESVQLMVIPDEDSLDGYITLENKKGEAIELSEDSIIITQNAAQMMDLAVGTEVLLQNSNLDQEQVTLTGVTQNYLGNCIYMKQGIYEKLFGEYKPNGILAHLSGECGNQPEYARNLGRQDKMLSAVSTAALERDFEANFAIVNAVVYLITVMAAGLAFVVLFTLSTTNISERERELSTIKVLGFYDPEVHQYVNRETVILTVIGILMGLPAGRALSECLTYVLNMPSIHFAVSVKPVSYLITAGISLCFALIVEVFTNRVLDRIDMVGALKSVE